MLFGVAEAAAKMLGVLQAVNPGEVLLQVPSVLTAKPPGDVFFTGTTTLLQKAHREHLGQICTKKDAGSPNFIFRMLQIMDLQRTSLSNKLEKDIKRTKAVATTQTFKLGFCQHKKTFYPKM